MERNPVTQFEIDALMVALNRGREVARTGRGPAGPVSVKVYDFKRPDKLSKDHVRTLQMIHDSFARLLSSSLSAYLRILVQANLASVEQSTNDEYMSRIVEPTVLSLVSLRPLTGRVVLELGVDAAFVILDRLLGGEGRHSDRPGAVTDIELSLLESVAGTFLSSLAEAWTNVVALEPVVDDISLNPQFFQRALPNDSIVLFSFEIRIQDTMGTMRLSIPYATLEPITGKLNVQHWFTRGASGAGDATDLLRERLDQVSLPIRVELGHAVVTVRELSDLQTGDVILLDTFVDDELDVCVGNDPKFRGCAGVQDNRIAVQITQPRGATTRALTVTGGANGH